MFTVVGRGRILSDSQTEKMRGLDGSSPAWDESDPSIEDHGLSSAPLISFL